MNDMKEIIDEIKARCDIASVISEYIKINPSGRNYKGLCPFHVEKTPSFYINTSKQIYKCFGCGEGGDVINFIMKMENLEFMDAVKFLAARCGIEINLNLDEEAKERLEKAKRYQDIHVEAARFYYRNLVMARNRGYEYFRRRGLDDRTIKHFGLGYSNDSWNELKDYLIEKKNFTIEELVECGLVGKSTRTDRYYDKFRNRVMFPIFDYRGNVIGFGGRVLDDSLPKYLNSPDTLIFNKRHNLYGLNFARRCITDRTLILVEGYMDLISLYQYGISSVVATLGTAITQQQAVLIKRYADTVIISYDSDGPGIKASLRAIEILTKEGLSVKVLNLKDSKDPDEFVRKYGVESYRQAMDEAVPRVRFRLDVLKKDFNLENDEDRVRFAKEAVGIIKTIKSPVEIDYYVSYISGTVGMSEDSIKKEIYGKSYRGQKFKNKKDEKIPIERMKAIENGEINIEIILIKMMFEDEQIREVVSLKLDKEDFINDESKKVFDEISKLNVGNERIIEKVDEIGLSEEYKNMLENISIEAINKERYKDIEETIKSVKRNGIKYKINELRKKQSELERKRKALNKDDKTEMKEADVEIMNIALQIVEMNKRFRNL